MPTCVDSVMCYPSLDKKFGRSCIKLFWAVKQNIMCPVSHVITNTAKYNGKTTKNAGKVYLNYLYTVAKLF